MHPLDPQVVGAGRRSLDGEAALVVGGDPEDLQGGVGGRVEQFHCQRDLPRLVGRSGTALQGHAGLDGGRVTRGPRLRFSDAPQDRGDPGEDVGAARGGPVELQRGPLGRRGGDGLEVQPDHLHPAGERWLAESDAGGVVHLAGLVVHLVLQHQRGRDGDGLGDGVASRVHALEQVRVEVQIDLHGVKGLRAALGHDIQGEHLAHQGFHEAGHQGEGDGVGEGRDGHHVLRDHPNGAVLVLLGLNLLELPRGIGPPEAEEIGVELPGDRVTANVAPQSPVLPAYPCFVEVVGDIGGVVVESRIVGVVVIGGGQVEAGVASLGAVNEGVADADAPFVLAVHAGAGHPVAAQAPPALGLMLPEAQEQQHVLTAPHLVAEEVVGRAGLQGDTVVVQEVFLLQEVADAVGQVVGPGADPVAQVVR